MFNQIDQVKTYLCGNKIPVRAIDECIFLISRYYKALGNTKAEIYDIIDKWVSDNGLYYNQPYNPNIENAFLIHTKLVDGFKVYINDEDISIIKKCAWTKKRKLVALFLLIYAKIYANEDGKFKIRVSAMSEWLGIDRLNIYNYYFKPLIEYGFMKTIEQPSYSKYLKNKNSGDRRATFIVKHKLINSGKYLIERNEDFEKLCFEIFG